MFGVTMFALQIKLPDMINGTLTSVGMFIGPNAMLIAGMLIATIPLRTILSSKRIYLVTFLRLIMIPLILLVIVKVCGFAGWVENGEIQYPVAEITIAGQLPDMLRNIVAVADDIEHRSNIQTGSILLEKMKISGNSRKKTTEL